MSRRKLKGRDKVLQKMSRDGVVEINAVTGDEESISKRETDFDIRGDKSKREALSQVGTRFGRSEKSAELLTQASRSDSKPSNNKKTSRRYSKPLRETTNPQRQNENTPPQADTVKHDTPTVTEQKNTEPPRHA